ncbi:arsenate reductase [Paucimonas lemoignei]|uniref:Arsenate reductase n=1 Tax=Paucimonas lemoignei TaxID=29443 RepID=A0A4V2UJB8_PAULE|nr:ArsC family reductase [Paucimonas lemoignei]TCS39550.1 arsenate reductase [Paucimonas lemoignei]
MSITLFGIPNCDTVKKARTWLEAHGISYTFHDFKKAGISPELIANWLKDVEWGVLVNRKGTTWRNLDSERKEAVVDAASAAALITESPSIVKRPVLVKDGRTHVGFTEAGYQQIFEKR